MLNPDEFKKKAIAKRLSKLGKDKNLSSAAAAEARAQRVNDKQISDLIKKSVAPPPNKPAYKAPANKPLSTKTGPHNVFNPKAKIDKSQVENRSQSDAMDNFVNRLAGRKAQMRRPKKSPILVGTKNKEALLKRLREKRSA